MPPDFRFLYCSTLFARCKEKRERIIKNYAAVYAAAYAAVYAAAIRRRKKEAILQKFYKKLTEILSEFTKNEK